MQKEERAHYAANEAQLKKQLQDQGALIEGTSKMVHVIDIINLSICARMKKKQSPMALLLPLLPDRRRSY